MIGLHTSQIVSQTNHAAECLFLSGLIHHLVLVIGCPTLLLQQVGSPKDIYTRPVNRFVASFIGETNFLPATGVAGGAKLGCGAVVDGVAAQGAVTLTIRPEQVRLTDAAEPGSIPATVTLLVYFGTDTHVHLDLADGTELVARVQSPATGDAGLERGTKVGVRFAPGALQIVGE